MSFLYSYRIKKIIENDQRYYQPQWRFNLFPVWRNYYLIGIFGDKTLIKCFYEEQAVLYIKRKKFYDY
jgi:hypothetical protein